jgi:hypothetical protein
MAIIGPDFTTAIFYIVLKCDYDYNLGTGISGFRITRRKFVVLNHGYLMFFCSVSLLLAYLQRLLRWRGIGFSTETFSLDSVLKSVS